MNTNRRICCNNEKGIEDLKATKSSIDAQIESEEAEKARLQREVERLSGRISQLNESLGKKSAARVDYDRTIQETESAYLKAKCFLYSYRS